MSVGWKRFVRFSDGPVGRTIYFRVVSKKAMVRVHAKVAADSSYRGVVSL